MDSTKDIAKKHYYDIAEFGFKKSGELGGQQCGIQYQPYEIKCYDLGVELSINCHRSRIKNKELAHLLFDLIIEEIIK
jgi:hypothetical protein